MWLISPVFHMFWLCQFHIREWGAVCPKGGVCLDTEGEEMK